VHAAWLAPRTGGAATARTRGRRRRSLGGEGKKKLVTTTWRGLASTTSLPVIEAKPDRDGVFRSDYSHVGPFGWDQWPHSRGIGKCRVVGTDPVYRLAQTGCVTDMLDAGWSEESAATLAVTVPHGSNGSRPLL
jgi:hypothetical protein